MAGARTRRLVWLAVAPVLLAVGPWPSGAAAPSDPVPARVPDVVELAMPGEAMAVPVSARDVVTAVEAAAGPDLSLGVSVLDLHTGELALGRAGARQFMSASLVKLIVAVDVLDQHRARGQPLDPVDRDLIDRALSASDDGAMNVLWGEHDGVGAVARVAGRLGLTAAVPPGSAAMWGDTVVSATDMVTVYRHVLTAMAPQDCAVVVDALSAATPVAADGFPQDFGLLHKGASVRHYAKQGWVPWGSGELVHSAGVVYDGRSGHRYAIALLSVQPGAGEQAARDRLSTVGAAATALLAA